MYLLFVFIRKTREIKKRRKKEKCHGKRVGYQKKLILWNQSYTQNYKDL